MNGFKTDPVRSNYDNLAATYESRWLNFNAAVRRWVMDRFPDSATGSVIDLGCGTGAMLRMVHERRPAMKLTGIDISPDMLAIARRDVPEATLIEDDITTAPREAFDVVLSLNILHHLDDAAAHLAMIKQLCKAGGTAFLCDFSIDTMRMGIADGWWRLSHPAYRKGFSAVRLRRMIGDTGLAIRDRAILKPDWFWRLQIYRLGA